MERAASGGARDTLDPQQSRNSTHIHFRQDLDKKAASGGSDSNQFPNPTLAHHVALPFIPIERWAPSDNLHLHTNPKGQEHARFFSNLKKRVRQNKETNVRGRENAYVNRLRTYTKKGREGSKVVLMKLALRYTVGGKKRKDKKGQKDKETVTQVLWAT